MSQRLGRGVKCVPYAYQDRPVLICVDSFGNMVRQVVMKPHGNPVRAADTLMEWLDRYHPAPQLKLVKTSASEERRPAREIDPRLYSDPRSPLAKQAYRRLLIQAGAAKIRRFRDSD